MIRTVLAIGLLITAHVFQPWSVAAERPNVIIIYADDLGNGDLGCYGHPTFKTPRLDKMAAEGIRLTNFYSSAPYCAPSRATLMTGRYPFRCGMLTNPLPLADLASPGNQALDNAGLPVTERTLGQLFQDGGYQTACVGKWHLGHKPQFLPTRRGFHEYLGILYSNDMHPVELYDGEKVVEFPVEQRTLTRRYTERSLQFIEKNRDRPFFLYMPQVMPHKPLAASDAFAGSSGHGLYADVIAELDWSVGQILDRLKQLDLERKTLVVFSSDNGPWFGGSTGGLRGMKSQLWDGGLRVPCIARLPGVIPPAKVSDEVAMIGDLFVTSLRIAGLEVPNDRTIDGRDLRDMWMKGGKSPHEAIIGWQGTPRTIRLGKWKLHVKGTPGAGTDLWDDTWIDPRAPNGTTILAPAEQYKPSAFPGVKTGDRSQTTALFDLSVDPSEQHNVADQHPEVVKRLQSKFDELTRVD